MTLQEFITQKIREAIAGAVNDVEDELTRVAKAGGDAAHGGFWGDVSNITSIISDLAGPLEVLVGLAVPPIGLMEAAEKAGGEGGRAFGIGWWIGSEAFQSLRPVMLPLEHAIANFAQTEIFDPATAAELEAKGIISNETGRSEAAGGNLSGEHYDKLVENTMERPDIVTALDLWNRGQIDESFVNATLQHHKVPAAWWQPLKAMRRKLLSPADLALAELRGTIDKAFAQNYANVAGFTPEDFQILIDNTGEPPGAAELMFALRRDFIDQDRFERGLRQSRYRDEWIDVFTKLRFSPMSASDAVRAVVEGHIPDDEGKQIAIQNGLEPDHWEILVQAWGRPPSHEQMMELYHRGQATLDQVKQAILESDIKNKYVDQMIDLGRVLVPQRTIILMLQHGVITHERAHTMLTEQGYNDDDAEAFIKLGMAEHKTGLHALTKTDIVTAYVDKLMTHQDAAKRLTNLGYTDADANELLDLADVKAENTALRSLKSGVEASLKAHHLTPADAKTELVRAGIEATQAQALVDQWTMLRGTPSRGLTEAQILKMGEDRILDVTDVRNRLIALGLVKQDADLLMQLHGIIPFNPVPADDGGFNPPTGTPPAAPF